jgi:FKBP-type peptidyl-prolyl cis-trans isomerase FklB
LLCLLGCGCDKSSVRKQGGDAVVAETSVDPKTPAEPRESKREQILKTIDAEQQAKDLLNNTPVLKEASLQKEKDFFAQLSQDKSVQSLADGVCYKVLQRGSGEAVEKGTFVTFHYQGRLLDGTVFVDRDENMIPVGYDFMVAGLESAISAMTVGDEWEVYVPSAQGYSDSSNDKIPAHSTLIYRVKLLSVYRQS